MLKQFRTRYPQGSLISELIEIDRGHYIVKVTLQNNQTILATGLAAADKVETAEDKARERALLALALDSIPTVSDAPKQVNKSIDRPINNYPAVVNLPINSESTINKETNSIKPLPVNPPVTSALNTVAHNIPVDSLTSTSSPVVSMPEIDPTDLNITPVDVPLATPSQDVTEEREIKASSTAVTAMAEISPEKLGDSTSEVASTQSPEIVEIDFNEIKNQTEVEMKRLGWTKERGRDFLLATYGKRSRLHLTDEELMDFLRYLESQ